MRALALLACCVVVPAAPEPRAGTIAPEATGLRAARGALRVELVRS